MTELWNSETVNVGVVGATGLVGGHMLDILSERNFPVGELRPFASERSAGSPLLWKDDYYRVRNAADAEFDGLDVVFFSAGAAASRELAPVAADAGAVVIDNSSAWRKDPDVPLVVSEVNPGVLADIPKGIVANPNCTTMVAMPVLKPLHDAARLEAIVATTFQAVSGTGQNGIRELERQLANGDAEPNVYPKLIAGNVIPLRGNPIDRDTDEELKLLHESRKILAIPDLAVSATCVTVPVNVGHSLSIETRFEEPITSDEAERLLNNAPGVRLDSVPTPLDAAGGDVSLVGRMRQSRIFGEYGLSLFLSGDNLRKGAALNAIQIAELLVQNPGLLRTQK